MRLGDALIVLGGGLEQASERQFKREEQTAEVARQENLARFQHKMAGARDDKNFGQQKELVGLQHKNALEVEDERSNRNEADNASAERRATARDKVMMDHNDKMAEKQESTVMIRDMQQQRAQLMTARKGLEDRLKDIQIASSKTDIVGNPTDPQTGMSWKDSAKRIKDKMDELDANAATLNESIAFEYQRSQGKGVDAPPPPRIGSGGGGGGGGGPQGGRRHIPKPSPESRALIPPLIRR
jgi:hypothetical protein